MCGFIEPLWFGPRFFWKWVILWSRIFVQRCLLQRVVSRQMLFGGRELVSNVLGKTSTQTFKYASAKWQCDIIHVITCLGMTHWYFWSTKADGKTDSLWMHIKFVPWWYWDCAPRSKLSGRFWRCSWAKLNQLFTKNCGSDVPFSLTRNLITSHRMKILAFHSLLRWKMIILPILTTSLIHFSS